MKGFQADICREIERDRCGRYYWILGDHSLITFARSAKCARVGRIIMASNLKIETASIIGASGVLSEDDVKLIMSLKVGETHGTMKYVMSDDMALTVAELDEEIADAKAYLQHNKSGAIKLTPDQFLTLRDGWDKSARTRQETIAADMNARIAPKLRKSLATINKTLASRAIVLSVHTGGELMSDSVTDAQGYRQPYPRYFEFIAVRVKDARAASKELRATLPKLNTIGPAPAK